jgi:nucleoside-diphosphate-sugar epimerase
MSRVLVTGATGFIGQHLVPLLKARGHSVTAVGSDAGDIADPRTWEALPVADALVHLAGKSFVPESWTAPEQFFSTNVVGAVAALNYCKRHAARLVLLSSYLYGNPRSLPIAEDAPLSATNPYALTKLMAEQAAGFFANAGGLRVAILRLFNVYGPGQSGKFLIPLIVEQVKTGKQIHVQDLLPRRDYVYVGDVVRAIEAAAASAGSFSVYNIGSGQSHSVAEVIGSIQQAWGTQLPVSSADLRRDNEILDTVADITAARRDLHWAPEFALADGLRAIHAADAR